MRSGTFEHDEAVLMWELLCSEGFNATLTYSHHERMIPTDIYQVSVPLLGRMDAERLLLAMRLAESQSCQVHLIGEGLLILRAADS